MRRERGFEFHRPVDQDLVHFRRTGPKGAVDAMDRIVEEFAQGCDLPCDGGVDVPTRSSERLVDRLRMLAQCRVEPAERLVEHLPQCREMKGEVLRQFRGAESTLEAPCGAVQDLAQGFDMGRE